MILYIIYLVGGLLIGLIVATLFWVNYIRAITFGTLRFVREDEKSDPYLFLDMDNHPDDIKKLDHVVFNVDPKEVTPRR